MTTRIHSKTCLAAAVICAIENYRDNDQITDDIFAIMLAQVDFISIGRQYLDEGDKQCECTPIAWMVMKVDGMTDEATHFTTMTYRDNAVRFADQLNAAVDETGEGFDFVFQVEPQFRTA